MLSLARPLSSFTAQYPAKTYATLLLTALASCAVSACSQRQPGDAAVDAPEVSITEPMDATLDAADATVSPVDAGDATIEAGATDDAMDAGDVAMDASENTDAKAVDADGDAGVVVVPNLGDAACGARITPQTIQDSPHQDFDASIMWNSNPPNSGPHFGIWAKWGIYPTPIPRGYYVHNLEHSGVVITYRCASRTENAACTAMHDQLAAFVNALPPEATCVGSGVRRRIILTPDPLITTAVAGSAWGYTYNANCVDTRSLEIFVLSVMGRGPEDFCADGFYPELPPPVDAGPDSG